MFETALFCRVQRIVAAALITIVLVAASAGMCLADITGRLAGTVTDAATKKPVAHARVTVTSPTGTFSTRSDEHGAFVLTGIPVDTYTVMVDGTGYNAYSVSGVNITQDETVRFDAPLSSFKIIGGTKSSRARSLTSAFQPDQTVDRVTVNAAGIEQLLGKTFNTNAKQLLSELPSVTIDKNGTALIRGGTSFEDAFEFEGIDYNEPNKSLANRFENLGSSYLLNGVGSIDIIPGGGDATHGNTGTGLISLTAKRGTWPGFLNVDLEQPIVPGALQRGLEYGVATRNLRLSNYLSFIADDEPFYYGGQHLNAASIAADPTTIDPALSTLFASGQRSIFTTAYFNKSQENSRNFLDNLVYRFGRDNGQSLQIFVNDQVVRDQLDYGGYAALTAVPQTFFFTNNPLVNPSGSTSSSLDNLFGSNNPAAAALARSAVTPVFGAVPGQPLNAPESIVSPFSAYKIEYSNNLDGATTLRFRAYRTDNEATESLPSQGLYIPQSGGIRKGLAFDASHALSDRHLLQVGGNFAFTHPFGQQINYVDYTGVYEGTYVTAGAGLLNLGPLTHDIIADFVTPQAVGSTVINQALATTGTPGCLGATVAGSNALYVPSPQAAPQEHCGYLNKYFPKGLPALPPEVEVPTANQQSYALYFQDTYSPNSRFKLLAGVRLDGYNFLLPDDPLNPPAIDGIRHQRLYEPHFGAAYRVGAHDAFRANFGRTLAIPLPTFLGVNIDRSAFAAFTGVPSYDSVTGKPATYCGPGQPVTSLGLTTYVGNQPCANYADQLYWLVRNARFAAQSQITYPLQGATFSNIDFSYSHEFAGGAAFKLTPFYRRGFNIVEQSQTLLGIDSVTGTQLLSPSIESNLGLQKAFGVEFLATTPLKPVGLSGTLSATYINQIGNDPPGDYLPTASVQLGQLYHSPTLAPLQTTLALTYRTKFGLRVNPVFTVKSGYPYGAGVYQALSINGQPYYVPYTNAVDLNAYSPILSACTLNPQNPGTLTAPNCAATRGLEASTSGPGSLLSRPFFNTDLTIELTPPQGHYGLTYGIAIRNLLDNVAGVPVANLTRDCVLVSTGLCASSGNASIADPFHAPQATLNSASSPYIVYPNQAPFTIRLYVQAAL